MQAVQRNALERAIVSICSVVLWVTTAVIFVILTANTVLRYTGRHGPAMGQRTAGAAVPLARDGRSGARRGKGLAHRHRLPDGSRAARVQRVVGVVGWLVVAALYATLVEGDLQHAGDRAGRDSRRSCTCPGPSPTAA